MKEKRNNSFMTFKTLLIMVLISVLGLVYVWQHVVITKLGYEIRKNEVAYNELVDERARLLSTVARMEAPSNINMLLASLNVDLKISKDPKVVRVKM
ncbi:MAG: hypothetical protein ACD_79C01510G0002 [uncultured bacterium]|nr:MAG: hypothetical protein ACD_79C01510G0002 [uncultured bacterium]